MIKEKLLPFDIQIIWKMKEIVFFIFKRVSWKIPGMEDLLKRLLEILLELEELVNLPKKPV